ncbi:hypothetical protein HPB50_011195 [Hyalomma asiaticum]|uniref:Uncharacterized protein n=1 Tax=Hyalomma asiaticum TaxID=266040 RepID=A0ACB7SEI7_HYAAI|nr:hypothetical protein HPB50_011195 [Hyalomma asiaticum]
MDFKLPVQDRDPPVQQKADEIQFAQSSSPENVFLYTRPSRKLGVPFTAISAYLGPERARTIYVLPSRDQNIIIRHTPDIEVADKLIRDLVVNIEKRQVLLQGYLRQDGGKTCQGANRGPSHGHHGNFNTECVGVPAPSCMSKHAAEHVWTLRTSRSTSGGGAGLPFTGAPATNSRNCAAKFCTPKTAAQKGGKKKGVPQKSRHPGLPSDLPRQEPSKTDKPAPPPGGRSGEMNGGDAQQARGLGHCC